MEIEEIIQECKRRFPIGCKFITALDVRNKPRNPSLHELNGHRFRQWTNSTYPKECQAIHEQSSSGLLYTSGVWGEVKEYPEGYIAPIYEAQLFN